MDSSLRLFIAIEIPKEAAIYVNQLIDRLRDGGFEKIRWVSMEGLHVTVKFLGRTSENLVRPITEAIEMASAEVNPFMLQIRDLGVFPHMRSPRVLWAGVHGQLMSLTYIKEVLERALESQGIPRDQRVFFPHLTLGRINGWFPPEALKKLNIAIKETKGFSPLEFQAWGLSLIESQFIREGVIYSRKAQTQFKN